VQDFWRSDCGEGAVLHRERLLIADGDAGVQASTEHFRGSASQAEYPLRFCCSGWVELENAIGGKVAEAIRESLESTRKAGAIQLDLPLEKKRTFDLEGEAKCNQ
jgi:hypothetical protein